MAKRRAKGAPADPEFAAHVAEQERIHREEWLARQSTGKPEGGALDPDYNQPSPLHVVPPMPRHVHDDSCLGKPYRDPGTSATGPWWVRACKVAGIVGLRPVAPNDGDSPGPPASWWTQLGDRNR